MKKNDDDRVKREEAAQKKELERSGESAFEKQTGTQDVKNLKEEAREHGSGGGKKTECSVTREISDGD